MGYREPDRFEALEGDYAKDSKASLVSGPPQMAKPS
jgi:hypothetical protein